jgi:hypothetical protein
MTENTLCAQIEGPSAQRSSCTDIQAKRCSYCFSHPCQQVNKQATFSRGEAGRLCCYLDVERVPLPSFNCLLALSKVAAQLECNAQLHCLAWLQPETARRHRVPVTASWAYFGFHSRLQGVGHPDGLLLCLPGEQAVDAASGSKQSSSSQHTSCSLTMLSLCSVMVYLVKSDRVEDQFRWLQQQHLHASHDCCVSSPRNTQLLSTNY